MTKYLVKSTTTHRDGSVSVSYYGRASERISNKTFCAEKIARIGFNTEEGARNSYRFSTACVGDGYSIKTSVVPFVV